MEEGEFVHRVDTNKLQSTITHGGRKRSYQMLVVQETIGMTRKKTETRCS